MGIIKVLAIIVAAARLLEATVRLLDPGFSLLDSLAGRSREVVQTALGAGQPQTRRLQYETAIATTEWQRLLAGTMRRLREDGMRFQIDHEGLPELAQQIVTGANRVALALVTLGLYLAASLLMQFKSGPQILDFPALPALFYAVAIWFTVRLVRGISRKA